MNVPPAGSFSAAMHAIETRLEAVATEFHALSASGAPAPTDVARVASQAMDDGARSMAELGDFNAPNLRDSIRSAVLVKIGAEHGRPTPSSTLELVADRFHNSATDVRVYRGTFSEILHDGGIDELGEIHSAYGDEFYKLTDALADKYGL